MLQRLLCPVLEGAVQLGGAGSITATGTLLFLQPSPQRRGLPWLLGATATWPGLFWLPLGLASRFWLLAALCLKKEVRTAAENCSSNVVRRITCHHCP